MVLYEENGKIVNWLIAGLKETIRLDVDKGRRCIPDVVLKNMKVQWCKLVET